MISSSSAGAGGGAGGAGGGIGTGTGDTVLQAAYVLHYTPFRDTSFIVDFFTLEQGRIGLVARGARSAKSRTRALYQPFRPVLVTWIAGKGDLHTLTGIEESGPAMDMGNSALACGYYLNELMLRLVGKSQAMPELFAHYALALANLSAVSGSGVSGSGGSSSGVSSSSVSSSGVSSNGVSEDIEIILRSFELQLLSALGLLPDFTRLADGGKVDHDQSYRYYPENALTILDVSGQTGLKSGLTTPDTHPDGVTPDKGIKVSGATLHALALLDFSNSTTLVEAKPLMRHVMRTHLGDRPLRSREMFDSLVRPDRIDGTDGTDGTDGHFQS